VRELSTWLSPADGVRLVHAALVAPDVGFAVVYGISANTRAWWDLAPARALGYLSVDDAEEYADRIPGADGEPDRSDPEWTRIGGPFAGPASDGPSLGRGAASEPGHE
jgi:uronate dehydrogenase